MQPLCFSMGRCMNRLSSPPRITSRLRWETLHPMCPTIPHMVLIPAHPPPPAVPNVCRFTCERQVNIARTPRAPEGQYSREHH